MTIFQRNYILLIGFILGSFFLLFPETSGAISYTTECGEKITIGSSVHTYCSSCCVADPCCTRDAKGNCIPDPCCTTVPCCPCCNQYSCSGGWKEYKANIAGCGPKILVRECRSVCGPATACCSCGPCQAQCDPWRTCEECGSWQKAERGCLATKAGLTRPECKCDKDCIDRPTNPRYYDNPNYPANPCSPEPSLNRNNIYLPLKLDWDNVRGWKDGWREGNTCPKTCSASCPDCPGAVDCYEKAQCVQSYVIRITQRAVVINGKTIEEEKVLIDGQVLGKSEYDILKERGSCFLKSNRAYQWQVRGCCGANGTDCGRWSEPWEFTTNAAPEPISPVDPDWAGKNFIENQPLEVELRWCNIVFQTKIGEEIREEKPKSFKLFFYLGRREPNREEIIIRHPLIGDFPKILSDPRQRPLPPLFLNERYGYFTKPPFLHQGIEYNFYAWEVAACERFDGRGKCTNFSQKWRFSLDKDIKLETPKLISPPNNIEIPIGFPVPFEWTPVLGGKSYILEIRKGGALIESKIIRGAKETIDFPKLLLNTVYQWRVKACQNLEGTQCEPKWSSTYSFKTTGQAPILIAPKGTDIIIPTDFQWEKVPGARSYVFKIRGPELDLTKTVDEKPKISLGFPDLRQEKTYSWQARACARTGGRICGDWSSSQTFTTFKLRAPANPFPENNAEIYTYQMPKTFFWDPVLGAKYYKLTMNYIARAAEEKDAIGCLEGKIKEKIIPDNPELITLHCLGNYQWQVRACLDENCQEAGNPAVWNFVLAAKEAPQELWGGLVPCGRDFDVPFHITPWDETKPCEIKHIFLLIQRIINFALWTLAPLALVLLTVYTGAMFYFSLSTGTSGTLSRVKSLWKAAGIGLGIIFFSWTIINLILSILGFQIDIFGRWYDIPI